MPLDRKKKQEERFEIENLLTNIRGEFGDEVKVMENEPPDFIVILPPELILIPLLCKEIVLDVSSPFAAATPIRILLFPNSAIVPLLVNAT
jgi:hypothetical protein